MNESGPKYPKRLAGKPPAQETATAIQYAESQKRFAAGTKGPRESAKKEAQETRQQERLQWLASMGLRAGAAYESPERLKVSLRDGEELAVFRIDDVGNMLRRVKLRYKKIPQEEIQSVWKGDKELWRREKTD